MTQLQGGGADLTDHNDNSGDERRGSLFLVCRWKKTTRDKKQESGGLRGRLRLLQQEDGNNKAQDVSLFPKSELISVYVRARAFV